MSFFQDWHVNSALSCWENGRHMLLYLLCKHGSSVHQSVAEMCDQKAEVERSCAAKIVEMRIWD